MEFKKNQIVTLKKWDEILPTLTEDNGKYNHKINGLIVFPYCYNEDYGKEFKIKEIDEDGDCHLGGMSNFYHQDWLDIVL